MKEQTLAEYGSGSPYVKMLACGDPKLGKTIFLILSALGLLPWQESGGVVSDPSHLHVISIDQDCADRLEKMMELCGVKPEVIQYVLSKVQIYNMREDVAALESSKDTYNHSFFNVLTATRDRIKSKVKAGETHFVIMSSWTRMCAVMERALFGDPTGINGGKGYGSIDLWTQLKAQFTAIQNRFQIEWGHMAWEAHVGKEVIGVPPVTKDTLMVHGGAKNWPINTSHNVRIFRETIQHAGTKVDKMYVDPKPTFSFLPGGGRGTAAVSNKEPDLAMMLHNMGYQCGWWQP